jgi:DNA modification methylase
MPYSWIYEQQVKNVEKKDIGHPCILPIELTKKLFAAATKPGDTALILFAGSGNDMISALEVGCDPVYGVEINPDYCKLIERRLKEYGYEEHN